MTKHTPTPWTAEIVNNWPIEQEEANREFMLHAVNAHEELVQTVKDLIEELACHVNESPDGEIARALAVLAKAEVRS